MTIPYPLLFEPMLFEKVWGGNLLGKLGKPVPNGKHIGESWELADLASTSTTGAGGGSARSVIANGPLKGKTLHDATQLWGSRLLGRHELGSGGSFPLLVKLLDARENLSVQVHPSQSFAAAHPWAHLKTECWFIIDAEPGAVIYKGVRPGVTKEVFAAAIEDGTVVDHLVSVPAIPGEMHNLPSGTCHALGAGVLVAEVQTPSDTTFRVFDWGRTDRQLHIRDSLECITWGAAPPSTSLNLTGEADRLVTTPYFEVDGARLHGGQRLDPLIDAVCKVIIVVDGQVVLDGADYVPERLGPGTTICIPAAISRECAPIAQGETTLLRVWL